MTKTLQSTWMYQLGRLTQIFGDIARTKARWHYSTVGREYVCARRSAAVALDRMVRKLTLWRSAGSSPTPRGR